MMTFDEAHTLIKKGDLVSLRHELDRGLSPNLSNQFSWTLLMLAALEGNTSIGELVISRGAPLDTTNNFGETALSLAAHGGHAPFVRILLANGGIPRLPSPWTQSGRLAENRVWFTASQDCIGSGLTQ